MTDARANILARLRAAPANPPPARPDWAPPTYASAAERLSRFRTMLESVHAEVHEVTAADWPERLKIILATKGIANLLHAPATPHGTRIAQAWADDAEAPELVGYDESIEFFKDRLVSHIDAALTATHGGIAETGSLIVWPNIHEPRLMSLLPPIHVALVAADAIVDSLAEAMARQGWAGAMPTNALLISGPSKTADIEQTLAYGVHGPKELIVLVVRPAITHQGPQ
jgi:L-lactate dehydrogenase complex protein LldG